MNARAHLLHLIDQHYPGLGCDLIDRETTWGETEAGEPCLLVDAGSAMFCAVGDDLHLVEEVELGRVVCRVVRPDGSYSDTVAPNPLAPPQARSAAFN